MREPKVIEELVVLNSGCRTVFSKQPDRQQNGEILSDIKESFKIRFFSSTLSGLVNLKHAVETMKPRN